MYTLLSPRKFLCAVPENSLAALYTHMIQTSPASRFRVRPYCSGAMSPMLAVMVSLAAARRDHRCYRPRAPGRRLQVECPYRRTRTEGRAPRPTLVPASRAAGRTEPFLLRRPSPAASTPESRWQCRAPWSEGPSRAAPCSFPCSVRIGSAGHGQGSHGFAQTRRQVRVTRHDADGPHDADPAHKDDGGPESKPGCDPCG